MKKEFVKIANCYLPCNCLHYKYVLIKPKVGKAYYLYVPCGKCYQCRKKIASDWAYRLGVESYRSNVYNMLFTYADDKLPMHKGVPCLNRQQITEAIKRLRYYLYRYYHTKAKFFLVGEYSPEKKRPHYHALLFTDRPLQDLDKDLSVVNELLEKKCWKNGFANITAMRGNSCAEKLTSYMVTYMMTQLPSTLLEKSVRPFRIMSRNLGDNFADEFPEVIRDCHKRQSFTYKYQYKDINGKIKERERSYPRYYLKKYSTEFEADLRAEKYYTTCEKFYQFLKHEIENYRAECRKNYGRPNRGNYFNRLETLRKREKEFELENFRARKIHGDNHKTDGLPKNNP